MPKKILSYIISVILLLCTGCIPQEKLPKSATKGYIEGVWFSHFEIKNFLKGNFKEEFEDAVENCKTLGITDIFVQVRPFCDSLYPSELFPLWSEAKDRDFDILGYMLQETHSADIRFHAWINPYRVKSADVDIESLDENSPAKIWKDTDNICLWNGIYLNPASDEVKRLIIEGVRELLQNYDVDGIHFDDYFYPTADSNFDALQYEGYTSTCEQPLGLSDWRRANVNQLISGTYTAIKFFNKDLIFSISPAASIEKNRETVFADIEQWLQSEVVDWIIPQLYFGFKYPQKEFRFDNILNNWSEIQKKYSVPMFVGLGAYKYYEEDLPDFEEWNNAPELLAEQVEMCRKNPQVSGHVYYSYSSVFSENSVDILSYLKEKDKND